MTGIQIFNTIMLLLTLGLAATPINVLRIVTGRFPTRRDVWFWPIQAVFCVPFIFVLIGVWV